MSTMRRNKGQVMYELLPGKVIDYAGGNTVARVVKIRGLRVTELNQEMIVQRIADEARAWEADRRPALRDEVLNDPSRFVLIEPKSVQTVLWPRTFRCTRPTCGHVLMRADSAPLPLGGCPRCNGQLIQFNWVRIHDCGALEPVQPLLCSTCNSSAQVALDTGGSERQSNFRWVCRKCKTTIRAFSFGGRCPRCAGGADPNMSIELFRSRRVFIAQTTTLINIPSQRLSSVLQLSDWRPLAAAFCFNLPEVQGRQLSSFVSGSGTNAISGTGAIPTEELTNLLLQFNQPAQGVQLQAALSALTEKYQKNSASAITAKLIERTGVDRYVWDRAGLEMLEAVMPLETGQPQRLSERPDDNEAQQRAMRLGFEEIALASDFPLITATYGFTRVGYQPIDSTLNPFEADSDYDGRVPIFVDQINADALFVRLNPARVCSWLDANGLPPTLPAGADPDLARRGYFVRLLTDVNLRRSLTEVVDLDARVALVFGLLHTLSHLALRQATLRAGLDATSLSEYLLPRTLTFAIHCNNRFGATIGALTSLFEQSLLEWLVAIEDSRRCLYDPVCRKRSGSCHACTHLSEMSCRYFNLNLGRAFLFSGRIEGFPEIKVGYFDPSLDQV